MREGMAFEGAAYLAGQLKAEQRVKDAGTKFGEFLEKMSKPAKQVLASVIAIHFSDVGKDKIELAQNLKALCEASDSKKASSFAKAVNKLSKKFKNEPRDTPEITLPLDFLQDLWTLYGLKGAITQEGLGLVGLSYVDQFELIRREMDRLAQQSKSQLSAFVLGANIAVMEDWDLKELQAVTSAHFQNSEADLKKYFEAKYKNNWEEEYQRQQKMASVVGAVQCMPTDEDGYPEPTDAFWQSHMDLRKCISELETFTMVPSKHTLYRALPDYRTFLTVVCPEWPGFPHDENSLAIEGRKQDKLASKLMADAVNGKV